MNIIGLGHPGCAVANKFVNYSEYVVYCIDTQDSGYSGEYIEVTEEETHEAYEDNYKPIELEISDEPVIFIFSGAGKISGLSLKLLQGLKNKDIDILYIKPDLTLSSQKQRVRERLTFQIFQQYARSGIFRKMYIVDNARVEELSDGSLVKDYWDNMNEIIANTYHMINVFSNTEPLLKSSVSLNDTARIATFGYVDFETKKEKLLYDLAYPRVKTYYFGFNGDTIETDKNLLHSVRDFVKERTEDNVDVFFLIYSTSYEHNYVYSVQEASFIQEQNL